MPIVKGNGWKNNLKKAIELILEDRREDFMRGLSEDTAQGKIFIAWNGAIWNVDFTSQAVITSAKAGIIRFG